MKALITKNPTQLSAVTLLINMLLSVIGYLVMTYVLKMDNTSLSFLSVISCMFIGQLYASKYKEIPERSLVYKTVALFLVYQLILGIVLFPDILKDLTEEGFILPIAVFFAFFGFIFLICQNMFMFGAKAYIRDLDKQKDK